MDDLERITEITGAFDRRHPEPSKNYGIHGVEIRMILKGPLGATQFVVFTPMHLSHVMQEAHRKTQQGDTDDVALRCRYEPMGADVGYHSPVPMYEGQSKMDNCDYVAGGCYYDGSGLRADEWLNEKFLPGGSDAIWKALEEDYRERFQPAEKAEAGE